VASSDASMDSHSKRGVSEISCGTETGLRQDNQTGHDMSALLAILENIDSSQFNSVFDLGVFKWNASY
jgi:hypothetical protein